ncbi:unnamed protein product [Owenia fusiformis]|uniref:Transporter n=1 Tax=Owenia fusiformis TaxID=6347 RepID=A0A8S4MXD8_OWEFU|nr:unnamed protein product [Owenia fusiformis]
MPCFDKQKKWVLNHLPGQSDKKEVSSGEMEKALEAERPASYNDTGEEEGDENTERGNWTRQLDFVLSCVGYAVGLGNLWRFPYICMLNGGGAFLIPYFTFLIICGIPLFFMELTLGQFSSLSPISVWKMCPLFKGLGWGMVLVSGIVCVYYNVIITWCLYYLIMSFTSKLPWGSCDNSWNTDLCATSTGNKTEFTNMTISNVTDQSSVYSMVTAVTEMTGNFTNVTMGNVTEVKKMTSAEEYWQYNTLEMTKSMNELGGIRWQLLLCLVLSWVLVFVCLCKGVKSSGKVVYVTATAPYIFLVILLIRGLLLPGAMDGIKFYVTPDFKRLLDYKVWVEACLQIFYSLGPAWGGLITMSSYNKFHNNVYRDAIFVPCVNCGSSFFAGFVIFSVLGFMAKESGLNVKDVVKPGPGLAFSAYPQAITKLPISPLWAVMFFFMLLTLGLDTQASIPYRMFPSLLIEACHGLIV